MYLFSPNKSEKVKTPLFTYVYPGSLFYCIQGAEVPGDQLRGTVDGLVEGKEYEFRVMAHNKAGNSEPSDVSPAIKTKSRKGKFVLNAAVMFVYW